MPFVRGKAKARTEFGAKIGASIVEGYTFIDYHSWDAYNESQDLLLQIQLFKERFGYLPATILADKIYLNRSNRDILEDFEIHSYCKPLGRPPKDPPSDEMKSRMAKAIGERNEIECSFGTGKRIYRANDIRAKLPDTARCWTGMCYFVKNRDEVPQGTLSCPDRNLVVFHHYRHYEGLRLLPSVCEEIIIQQTLIKKIKKAYR